MATTTDVPGLFDVAIDGRGYKARAEHHRRRFHDLLREQADSGEEPSERSLNPQDLWRRGQTDFYLGAGQDWLDGEESDRKRYASSEHVDPWTEHQLSLLPSVTDVASGFSSSPSGPGVIADGELFVPDGDRLMHYDGSTWTATNTVPQDIVDVATDGTNVYIACRDTGKTAGGIYVIDTATGSAPYTPTLLNSVIPDLVAYVSGRLMVAAGYSLYNIVDVSSTDAPSALTAAAINDQWVWSCFAATPQFVLVGGYAGDRSMIYRITIREDGTALTAPVVASSLPEGEIVRTMTYYQSVVLIGTDQGLRVAPAQGGGLPFGSLAEVGAVHSLEPQGNYVWCGMADGTLTRVDLRRFLEHFDLLPARAPDLDANVDAKVLSIHDFDGAQHFVVEGQGVYAASAGAYESSGTYTSGKIGFGLIDRKQYVYLDVLAETLAAGETVTVELALDGGAWQTLGTMTEGDAEKSFTVTDVIDDPAAEYAEVRLTLAGDGTTTPTVVRWVLRAKPVAARTREVQVVLDLYETVLAYSDEEKHFDVWDELEALETLAESGKIVDYQEHSKSYKASVENVQLGPELKVTEDRKSWEGPCLVTLKVYR